MELDVKTVETDAGAYRYIECLDTDSCGNPLTEYDHPGTSFATYERGRHEAVNTLAGAAGYAVQSWVDHGYDDDEIERRFRLWQAITGDRTVLYTSEVWADRSTWYRVIVLVEYDPNYPDWDRKSLAKATVSEYEAWLRGEVYGYEIETPGGEHLDSCWGFIGEESREYMREQAFDIIEADSKRRAQSVNVVGAGFVGII